VIAAPAAREGGWTGNPAENRRTPKMKNELDRIYNKLRGRKLRYADQCTDGVMLGDVICHRLGVVRDVHPYFDDVDMVGPGEETIMPMALYGRFTIDDLIDAARPHLKT
jgi:hypothetical protein